MTSSALADNSVLFAQRSVKDRTSRAKGSDPLGLLKDGSEPLF